MDVMTCLRIVYVIALIVKVFRPVVSISFTELVGKKVSSHSSVFHSIFLGPKSVEMETAERCALR